MTKKQFNKKAEKVWKARQQFERAVLAYNRRPKKLDPIGQRLANVKLDIAGHRLTGTAMALACVKVPKFRKG